MGSRSTERPGSYHNQAEGRNRVTSVMDTEPLAVVRVCLTQALAALGIEAKLAMPALPQ